MSKYVFVTGGVTSSVGKGIVAASVAKILRMAGSLVGVLKLDPYLNVDPGTMNPYQHGEVYVLADGTETDLDLGHYERMAGVQLDRRSSITAGRIFLNVIEGERAGAYLGQTIQVIPHVTGAIIDAIQEAGQNQEVTIVEIGGTVGDIEGQPFLEAIRQMGVKLGRENCCFIHVALVPYLSAAGEVKTKPCQHSVQLLRQAGVYPNVLVCRTSGISLGQAEREKLSMFCNVPVESVFELKDLPTIYHAPVVLGQDGLGHQIGKQLGIADKPNLNELEAWKAYASSEEGLTRAGIMAADTEEAITIAIVGKYTRNQDAYKSIIESIRHASVGKGIPVNIKMVEARETGDAQGFDAVLSAIETADAIIIPGGFGSSGVETKLKVCRYARENKIPLLGICLGLQIIVIEFARNVLGYEDANSIEFDPVTAYPVVKIIPGQAKITAKGGTMRLGNYEMDTAPGSLLRELYAAVYKNWAEMVTERHRHRYEISDEYALAMDKAGLHVGGVWHHGPLIEVMEMDREIHPFYIGCQYHPEFISRPLAPHPLFLGLVEAGSERLSQLGCAHKKQSTKRILLRDMIDQINKDNIPEWIDTNAVGKETL